MHGGVERRAALLAVAGSMLALTTASASARNDGPACSIALRFHARDLHRVMGQAQPGGSPPFRVRLDGQPPGASHGSDVAPDGSGSVGPYRLYQLVRQTAPVQARLFEIEFLLPGAQAFAVMFG